MAVVGLTRKSATSISTFEKRAASSRTRGWELARNLKCPVCSAETEVPTCPSCGAELSTGVDVRDQDLTWLDDDQTRSDQDQTGSDHDQTGSDSDQRSSDEDQRAADDDLAAGGSSRAYRQTAEARAQSSRDRGATSESRDATAAARSQTAEDRDRAAEQRDQAADARDSLARLREREDDGESGTEDPAERVARDRARAAAIDAGQPPTGRQRPAIGPGRSRIDTRRARPEARDHRRADGRVDTRVRHGEAVGRTGASTSHRRFAPAGVHRRRRLEAGKRQRGPCGWRRAAGASRRTLRAKLRPYDTVVRYGATSSSARCRT